MGVGCCSKADIFGVVRDVSFGAKWEVDRVAVDDSLYVETLVECIVEGVRYWPSAIGFSVLLGFAGFVEFRFRGRVVRDIDGSVPVG